MTNWLSLREELDCWADEGLTATLWWRDDDAAAADPALDRLLGLGSEPLALAVIPKTLHEDAAGAILARATARVIQHGYAHRNHAAEGERKSELGERRAPGTVLDELAAGRNRLEASFGARFTPVLAPPWNRLAGGLVAHLGAIGFSGLTTYRPRAAAVPAPGLVQVNCHVDVIDWRGHRGFVGEDAALGLAVGHLRARRTFEADGNEPTGLLSHHLVHDEATWSFIEAFLDFTRRHDACRWLAVDDAFKPPVEE